MSSSASTERALPANGVFLATGAASEAAQAGEPGQFSRLLWLSRQNHGGGEHDDGSVAGDLSCSRWGRDLRCGPSDTADTDVASAPLSRAVRDRRQRGCADGDRSVNVTICRTLHPRV